MGRPGQKSFREADSLPYIGYVYSPINSNSPSKKDAPVRLTPTGAFCCSIGGKGRFLSE